MSPCSADPGAGSPGDGPADVFLSQLFIFKCASTTPTTVGKPLYSPWIGRVWSPAARGTSVALLRGSTIARTDVLVEHAGARPGWPRMDLRASDRPRRRHGSFIIQCGGLGTVVDMPCFCLLSLLFELSVTPGHRDNSNKGYRGDGSTTPQPPPSTAPGLDPADGQLARS